MNDPRAQMHENYLDKVLSSYWVFLFKRTIEFIESSPNKKHNFPTKTTRLSFLGPFKISDFLKKDTL